MRVPMVGWQAPWALSCAASACSEVRAHLLGSLRHLGERMGSAERMPSRSGGEDGFGGTGGSFGSDGVADGTDGGGGSFGGDGMAASGGPSASKARANNGVQAPVTIRTPLAVAADGTTDSARPWAGAAASRQM